jgi:hypothetical protein
LGLLYGFWGDASERHPKAFLVPVAGPGRGPLLQRSLPLAVQSSNAPLRQLPRSVPAMARHV